MPKFGPIIVSTLSRQPNAMTIVLSSGVVRRRASGAVWSRAIAAWTDTGMDVRVFGLAVPTAEMTAKDASGSAQSRESAIHGRAAR